MTTRFKGFGGSTIIAPMRGRKLNFRQVKQVQKIINSNKKLKSKWTFFNNLDMDIAGTLLEITAIPEGDDFNQRDTDKILVQSVKVQTTTRNGVTPGPQNNRIMLVRAKQGTLVIADMPSVSEEPDQDKMQVLYDEIIGYNDVDFDPLQRYIFKSFKKRNIPHLTVTYDDDESATAAQRHGIYFYVVGSTDTNSGFTTGYHKIKWFDAN